FGSIMCSARIHVLLDFFVVLVRCLVFVFFFQAEDGIRDWSVTGVQTCALPISRRWRPFGVPPRWPDWERHERPRRDLPRHGLSRSEERRVGKECRSRGWPYH